MKRRISMKTYFRFPTLMFIVLLLAGCQSNTAKISAANAASQYHECVYIQYNKAVSQGTNAGDAAIKQAISECSDMAMTYALAVSRENNHMPDKQYKNANETYRPIIEQETSKQLQAMIAAIKEG